MTRGEAHTLAHLVAAKAGPRLKAVDVHETLTGARIKITVHLHARSAKDLDDPAPHYFTKEELRAP